MVSFWWDSAAQATVLSLLRLLVLSSVVGVVSSRVKLDKAMMDESVLLGFVLVRIIVGAMEVSS